MNLHELDRLIASLDEKEDKDLIEFYLRKRKELVAEITRKVNEGLKAL